jgi:hypothetical protein
MGTLNVLDDMEQLVVPVKVCAPLLVVVLRFTRISGLLVGLQVPETVAV